MMINYNRFTFIIVPPISKMHLFSYDKLNGKTPIANSLLLPISIEKENYLKTIL